MAQTILVVDDDPKILKLLEHSLRKEDFTVITVQSGEEALDKVKLVRPDLVLLDLMMPGIDGFETCRQLKAISDVPIIILSARGDEIDKVVGFRMGVDDYQTKPFSPAELSLRVRAVLRRTVGARNEPIRQKKIIKTGNFIIDHNEHRLTVNDNNVDLTPKEFDLLWLLASHPNQVFSKSQLLDRVWNSTFPGDENTVTVHIRRLREKVENDPAKPKHIKTVWGVGYKFQN